MAWYSYPSKSLGYAVYIEDLESKDSYWRNPLKIIGRACEYGHLEDVRVLLQDSRVDMDIYELQRALERF